MTLQKEQGLITAVTDPNDPATQTALDHAMGLNCGDDVACWNIYPGFYYQLFGNLDSGGNRYLGAAASLMKSFNTPNGRGPDNNGTPAHVGDTITLQNTLGGYDGVLPQQIVTIADLATDALYRYTPHVFNGNYNFWEYFISWFKYPSGTLLKLANDTNTYIIENGDKQIVPQFVALARGLNLNNALALSQTEFNEYPTDPPLGPTDNTIVQVTGTGKKYVFLNNVEHPASDLVIQQRGLDPNNALTITQEDFAQYTFRSGFAAERWHDYPRHDQQGCYLVTNGVIQAFSAYSFAQHNITPKQIVTLPDSEIASYTQAGFVPPVDGSLIKSTSSGTVYIVENGQKDPILSDVFTDPGYSYKNVTAISDAEFSQLLVRPSAAPEDYTFFAVGSKTGPLYEFKEGATHSISAFVAKQRGITPDYVFNSDIFGEWQAGIPVPPRNG